MIIQELLQQLLQSDMECPLILPKNSSPGFDEPHWTCLRCGWVYKLISDKPPHRTCPALQTPEAKAAAKHAAKHGPGAQLHKLIEKLTGEGITASCKCAGHIAEMNLRGPAWCRKNVETIIGWLLEEVQRRIDKGKKDGKPVPWRVQLGGKDLPGRRYAMEKLILKAISRAEAAGASG